MYSALVEWLQSILGSSYQYSRGAYVDSAAIKDLFICVIHGQGGTAIDVDDRRPSYRVILLGPENGRQYAAQIQDDMELIMRATIESDSPCGAAHIQAINEPVGPAYTIENRPWCAVDLQVTF